MVVAIAAIERSRTQTARTGLVVAPPTVAVDPFRAAASQVFKFDESSESYLSDEDFEAAHRGQDVGAGSGRPMWLLPALCGARVARLRASAIAVVVVVLGNEVALGSTTASRRNLQSRRRVADRPVVPDPPKKIAPTPVAVVPVAVARPLFNGKDLVGWNYEKSRWDVVNGEILGTETGKVGSHELFAPGRYGDFELSFEAKADFDGTEHSHLLLRIDPPNDPAGKQKPQSLAIGMEGNDVFTLEDPWKFRNTLPASAALKNARKKDDYNAFVVRFVDSRLTVRLNGVETRGVKAPIPGDVRLSWHLGDRAPQLHLRNIRITELRPPLLGDWESLMTGRTLDPWWVTKNEPEGISTPELGEAMIHFRTVKAKDNYVATRKNYRSHHLRLEFKLVKGTKPPRLAIGPSMGKDFGCMLNFSDQQAPWINAWWAHLLEGTIERGAIVLEDCAKANIGFPAATPLKVGDWNRFEMIRLNDGIVYVLNDRILGAIAELRKATALEQAGLGATMINLLVNSGDVNVRRVQIREISCPPARDRESAAQ